MTTCYTLLNVINTVEWSRLLNQLNHISLLCLTLFKAPFQAVADSESSFYKEVTEHSGGEALSQ